MESNGRSCFEAGLGLSSSGLCWLQGAVRAQRGLCHLSPARGGIRPQDWAQVGIQVPWPGLCRVVVPGTEVAGYSTQCLCLAAAPPPRDAGKCLICHGHPPRGLLCHWSRGWPDQKQLLGERCVENWTKDFLITTAARLGSLPCCPQGRALGRLQGAPTSAGCPSTLHSLQAAPYGHVPLQQQARYPGLADPSSGSSSCHGSWMWL